MCHRPLVFYYADIIYLWYCQFLSEDDSVVYRQSAPLVYPPPLFFTSRGYREYTPLVYPPHSFIRPPLFSKLPCSYGCHFRKLKMTCRCVSVTLCVAGSPGCGILVYVCSRALQTQTPQLWQGSVQKPKAALAYIN